MRPGGLIVSDSDLVKRRKNPAARQIELPLQETIQKELQTSLPLNICVLGSLSRLIDFLKLQSLEKALEKRFKGRMEEVNKRALKIGYELTDSLVNLPPLSFL